MSGIKEKSFLEVVKRLFEPAFSNVYLYARASFVSATFFVFDIYTVLLLKYIASAFQNHQVEKMPRVLLRYAIIYIFMFLRKWFVKQYTRVTLKWYIPKLLYKKYLKAYIQLDSNAIEKL